MKTTMAPNAQALLYAAVRDGDEAAFSRYYQNTMPWLIPYIRRITKDIEEARNIAHDAFTKLWLCRDQIDPARSLDGFVTKIAANAALNLVRKKQSHSKYHSEQQFAQSAEELPADAAMLADEMEARIERAIARMPAQRRKVFELSRYENLTYNQIAEQMGLSTNTVKNYMKLALSEIRSSLLLILWCIYLLTR